MIDARVTYWKHKYDDTEKENKKLKRTNDLLTSKLYLTYGLVAVMVIYKINSLFWL